MRLARGLLLALLAGAAAACAGADGGPSKPLRNDGAADDARPDGGGLAVGGGDPGGGDPDPQKTVCDFAPVPDCAEGEAFQRWLGGQGGDWCVELGTPWFFSIGGGALRMVAKAGPKDGWDPRNDEDKVIMRLAGGAEGSSFRVDVERHPRLAIEMCPVRLPGKGADVTDSDRNDACFYLLVGFDGPVHPYRGTDGLPDTVAYVWADAPWPSGEVGRDPDYDLFMRYLAIGVGADELGERRRIVRDVAADFRKCFPERANEPVPDVVRVGHMIDSNTLDTEAESRLYSVSFMACEPAPAPALVPEPEAKGAPRPL